MNSSRELPAGDDESTNRTPNKQINTRTTNRLTDCDIVTNDRESAVEISSSSNENDLTYLEDNSDSHDIIAFKLSPRRWAILFGICTFGLLNGIVNETNTIQSTMVALLGIKLDQYIYLSQVFLYVVPLVALPSAWFLDKFGLRVSVHVAILLVAVRNGSRALLFWPTLSHWEELKLTYWSISALSQLPVVVMYYALPLKISENWFSNKERSIAWSLMIVTPIIGTAASSLVIPHYILNLNTVKPLAYLNLIGFVLTSLVIVCCITKSKPKHLPSARRAKASRVDGQSMASNLRQLFGERNIMIQMFVLIAIESMSMTITLIIPDILASAGLSQVFTGQFLASSQIACAIFLVGGSIRMSCSNLASQQATRSTTPRKSARTCKIYMGIISMSSITYITILSLKEASNHQWWLAIMATVLQTSLRSWAAPLYTNMVAQLIAGSISEASYMAVDQVMFCFLSSLFSFVFMQLRQVETRDGDIHYQQVDYSYSLLFSALVIVVVAIFYISSFRAKSKMLADEEEEAAATAGGEGSDATAIIRST